MPKQQPDAQSWRAPLLYRGARNPAAGSSRAASQQRRRLRAQRQASEDAPQEETPQEDAAIEHALQLPEMSQPVPSATAPDWRAQAEELAQRGAERIVEAEDTAKRQANALLSRFKPLAPDRVRGPEFGWSVATHRIAPLPGGGFAYSFNEHCQLVMFPVLFIGCGVGKIEANGDLFKYLHPPTKFGDWDKRDADP